MKKNKNNHKEIEKEEEKKGNKKTLIRAIIMLSIFVAGAIVIACVLVNYQISKNNDTKPSGVKMQEEIDKKIDVIQKKLDNSFKEYDEVVEYLTTWSYDEVCTNLLNMSDMGDVTIRIYVGEDELLEDGIVTFDKELAIKVRLKSLYNYEILGEKKQEIIESEKEYNINYQDTIFPVLSGVTDKTIYVGDKINILSGISANDEKEGPIEVKYEGTVNTNAAGSYKITVYAIDHNGNRTDAEMTITVKKKASTGGSSSSGGTSGGSTGGSTGGSSNNGCSSAAVLRKRGYKTDDKNACEKDKQSYAIAKQIADEILAKGYTTDLEKVEAAASKVSEYYYQGVHVESGYDYRTPYGVFVTHEASCAGCTRALILVLELMGFTNLTHANENGWTHQWVILTMDGKKGFADGQVGWAGYGCHPVAGENCL